MPIDPNNPLGSTVTPVAATPASNSNLTAATPASNSNLTAGTLTTTNATTPNTSLTTTQTGVANPLNVSQAPVNQAGLTTATQGTSGSVASQVSSLIDANSPLMQRAAAKANEQSNADGMLNSSMGIGAAQNAVIANAVPIAQSDAASANQFTLTNAQNANQTSQFNAGQLNTATDQQAQQAAQAALQTQQIGATSTLSAQQAGQATAAAAALTNTNLVSNSNQQITTAEQNLQQQTATIQNSSTMDTASKNAAIATLNANFQSAMQSFANISQPTTAGGLGLSGLLDFSAFSTAAPGQSATPGSTADTAASTTTAATAALAAKQSTYDTSLAALQKQLAATPTTTGGATTKRVNGVLHTYAAPANPAYAAIQAQITALGARPA